ncbi:MAG: DUF6770 family protein [Saprospiraceae bacterium]|nr:hypothetical protein [Lewinella sp.]
MSRQNFQSLLWCLVLIMLSSFTGKAQKRTFKATAVEYLVQAGTILNGDRIEGYFFLNRTEENKGRIFEFRLDLVDANLEPIGSLKLNESYGLNVRDIAYNGKYLAIEFMDNAPTGYTYGISKRAVWVALYDSQGNEVTSKEIEFTLYDKNLFLGYTAENITRKELVSAPDGFVNYSTRSTGLGQKKVQPKISFLPDGTEQDEWTHLGRENQKMPVFATFLAADEQTLLSLTYAQILNSSRTYDLNVLGVDLKSGKELFYFDGLESAQHPVWVKKAFIQEDEITLIGTYFFQNKDHDAYEDAKGIFSIRLNRQGQILQQEFFANEELLSNDILVAKDHPDALLHDIVIADILRLTSGQIIMPVEIYRLKKNPKGTKNNLLIRDIYLLYLSENLELLHSKRIDRRLEEKVYIGKFEKRYHTRDAVHEFDRNSYNYFKYGFSRPYQDGGWLVFLSKSEELENKKIVKTYFLDKANLIENEIQLDDQESFFMVFPAVDDYLMVLEYIKADKELDVRLERIKTE